MLIQIDKHRMRMKKKDHVKKEKIIDRYNKSYIIHFFTLPNFHFVLFYSHCIIHFFYLSLSIRDTPLCVEKNNIEKYLIH